MENTKYAPAERISDDLILEQFRFFKDVPFLQTVLNTVPDFVFILNSQRQIVYSNTSKNSTTTLKIEQVLGKRPGEVLNCIHAFRDPGGCGTTEFCRTCGAVNAILSSIKGISDEQECRISQKDSNEALDLRVFTSPITVNEMNFVVFAVTDISNEKRRRALERIFFHDIMNTAGGLKGISELLQNASEDELTELKEIVLELSENIIEEIQTQKELSAAENNELNVIPDLVNSQNILSGTVKSLRNHPSCKFMELKIRENSQSFNFVTDHRLLRRIIMNLTKNALEASNTDNKVIVGAEKNNGNAEFTVWNNTFIPVSTQNQIFQRSFSTKGEGRGLGTYSIKLLTERYLKGKISFSSSEKEGTLFRVVLPYELT